MADMKPCPFCGGKAIIRAEAVEDISWRTWVARVIVCCNRDTCGIRMHRVGRERNEKDANTVKDTFIGALTEKWNSRKSPPKKTKEDSHDRKSRVRSTSR